MATDIFNLESGSFPYVGEDMEIINEGPFAFACDSGHFPYILQEAYIQWTITNVEQLASNPIWYEGNYPYFEHVEGALPIDRVPPHWGNSAPPPAKLVNKGILGNIIRNDNPGISNWRNPGIVAESPLLYFFGCDVIPKEITIPDVLEAEYSVAIHISNNHLGKSIEIRSLSIINDPFNTIKILPHNWPRLLLPYSVATYSLIISGTEGYPKIDSTLIVDAGTCYTEIPITGARNVDCPLCPDVPVLPIIGNFDMTCAVHQDLCDISRGDTIPFTFQFTNPDGTEMDIQGMSLIFEMRLDPKTVLPDLMQEEIFIADADTVLGRGAMKILPIKTATLIAGMTYCYKFIFKQATNDIFTVGRGKVSVNPDAQAT